jgi:hypothetical protein
MTHRLAVRNWDKWQSYRKDRGQPPWIKVHRRLMRDPEWVELTDAQRGQLIAIWLLAADNDGSVPNSARLIQKLCYMDGVPDLELFVSLGFLDGGVKVTPTRRQHDAPEAEAKAETEAEKNTPPTPPPTTNGTPAEFSQWWQAYPKKVAKDAALTAWKKRKPGKALAAEMLSAIESQCRAGHFIGRDGGEYIPNPATWLNQGRWQDEVRGTKDVGRRADDPPEYDAAVLDELAPLVDELDERDERGRPKTSYREREEKLQREAERRGIEVRPGLYEAVSAHRDARRVGGGGA